MNGEYQVRSDEWGQAYEDFEPSEVVNLVVATGEWLERLLLSPAPTDAAMKALYRELFGPQGIEHQPDASWRSLWSDVPDEFTLPTSDYLVSLNAYAFGGLRPHYEKFPYASNDEEFVTKARALLDAIPSGWGTFSDIERTVLAAEARHFIDNGRDVAPEQLAALARVSLKSIKNLLTPKGGTADLKLNADGKVPGPDAHRWLIGRPDFKPTISPDADDGPGPISTSPAESLGEVVFVPVAKDGSWFDPATCRNTRGFTIGPKGSEEAVEDYWTALDRLAHMPTPYWRRPTSAGNWRIVAGISWQRKVVSELGLSADGARR